MIIRASYMELAYSYCHKIRRCKDVRIQPVRVQYAEYMSGCLARPLSHSTMPVAASESVTPYHSGRHGDALPVPFLNTGTCGDLQPAADSRAWIDDLTPDDDVRRSPEREAGWLRKRLRLSPLDRFGRILFRFNRRHASLFDPVRDPLTKRNCWRAYRKILKTATAACISTGTRDDD